MRPNNITAHPTLGSNFTHFKVHVDGVKEQDGSLSYWSHTELDHRVITNIMSHIGTECNVMNVVRLGKFIPGKHRSIVFDVADEFMFKQIFKNASKLKSFPTSGVYVKRFLSRLEAANERLL